MKANAIVLGMLTGLYACAPAGSNVVYSQQGNVSKNAYKHVSAVAERRNATQEAIGLIAGSAGYAVGHVAAGGTAATLNTSTAVEAVTSNLNPTPEPSPEQKDEMNQ